MRSITVCNRQRKLPCDRKALERFAVRAVEAVRRVPVGPGEAVLEGLPELEISLLSDAAMSEVHAEFFQDPSPTDVITFPHGEILLGVETIAENARRFSEDYARELRRCLLHGVLHLHGYEDGTRALRRAMFARQERLLQQLCRA